MPPNQISKLFLDLCISKTLHMTLAVYFRVVFYCENAKTHLCFNHAP